MRFSDYVNNILERKNALIETKKIVKLICIKNSYFVNRPLLDTLVCDINALSYFADTYYTQCKEINELDKFEQFMTDYRALGYPCCDSLLYTIYATDNQPEKAFSYLQKACENREPAAEYLNGHYQILHGDKKKGIAIIKNIADDANSPFQKKAAEILETLDINKKSGSVLGKAKRSLKKGIKTVVKLILIILGLINLFSGSIDGFLLIAGVYIGLKVLSYAKKLIFSPAELDDESYLTLYDKHFEINNPLFESQIVYPKLDIEGDILLPCPFSDEYDETYTAYIPVYDSDNNLIDWKSEERTRTNKVRLEEDLIVAVHNILLQINHLREAKREVLKELCIQGDSRANFALQTFFNLTYTNGQFQKCENQNVLLSKYIEDLANYVD